MADQFTAPITYFLQEGQANLDECLRIAFDGAAQHQIKKIVIFTAQGSGVRRAIEKFTSQDEYKDISLIAVQFPFGKEFTDKDGGKFTVEITREDRELFNSHGVPIIRANLPFDPIKAQFRDHGVLGQDLSLIGNALNMFCGSMNLCVQASLLACDAGEVSIGEHIVAMASDTAILVKATTTSRMLTDLIIREIFCKPAVFTIGKRETSEGAGSGLLPFPATEISTEAVATLPPPKPE
jgi:uncharacterized protein